MLKKHVRISIYISLFSFALVGVISCEEDFTDIGTSIVSNNDFTTGDTVMEIEFFGKEVNRVRADGLSLEARSLPQYLLGVYNNNNYEKIEASIISQLQIPSDLTIVDKTYGVDTTVVTTIDTVFLRIPYQATLNSRASSGPDFTLDSIIGNQEIPFTLNVFRLSSFLNTLDPTDPSKTNTFYSDHDYKTFPEKLNTLEDFQFKPIKTDTSATIFRKLSTGDTYEEEEIKYDNGNPFIRIPLKKDRIQELFFDQYKTSNFSSQDAFNNYFRGIKIETKGNGGSLISLDFANTNLPPTIDIYYTNTVLKLGTVVDTIKKNDTFLLAGVRNNIYKMTPGKTPATNNIPIQGVAGKIGQINLFGNDGNNNGVPDGLDALRDKNALINDATLTLYVDQNIVGADIIATPFRLYVYKESLNSKNEEIPLQILDIFSEFPHQVGGRLSLDEDEKPDYYTFKITDYISELVSGRRNDLETLGIKVFNPTDLPANLRADIPLSFRQLDSILRPYNWNPKAVMLLNHNKLINGSRRATLKVSYSQKINRN